MTTTSTTAHRAPAIYCQACNRLLGRLDLPKGTTATYARCPGCGRTTTAHGLGEGAIDVKTVKEGKE